MHDVIFFILEIAPHQDFSRESLKKIRYVKQLQIEILLRNLCKLQNVFRNAKLPLLYKPCSTQFPCWAGITTIVFHQFCGFESVQVLTLNQQEVHCTWRHWKFKSIGSWRTVKRFRLDRLDSCNFTCKTRNVWVYLIYCIFDFLLQFYIRKRDQNPESILQKTKKVSTCASVLSFLLVPNE